MSQCSLQGVFNTAELVEEILGPPTKILGRMVSGNSQEEEVSLFCGRMRPLKEPEENGTMWNGLPEGGVQFLPLET